MIAYENFFGVGTGKGVTEIGIANRGIDVPAGSLMVLSIGLNSDVSVESVPDSLGDSYSFSTGLTNPDGVRTEIWTFKTLTDIPSGLGVISVKTNSAVAMCAVANFYSGVVSLGQVGSGFSGSPNSMPVGSLNTQDDNNWVVFSFNFRGSASVQWPGGIGNLRLTEPTFGHGSNSNCHVGASDNSSSIPNSVENEVILSGSSSWVGASLELRA